MTLRYKISDGVVVMCGMTLAEVAATITSTLYPRAPLDTRGFEALRRSIVQWEDAQRVPANRRVTVRRT